MSYILWIVVCENIYTGVFIFNSGPPGGYMTCLVNEVLMTLTFAIADSQSKNSGFSEYKPFVVTSLSEKWNTVDQWSAFTTILQHSKSGCRVLTNQLRVGL